MLVVTLERVYAPIKHFSLLTLNASNQTSKLQIQALWDVLIHKVINLEPLHGLKELKPKI